jgi:hypothetical protein
VDVNCDGDVLLEWWNIQLFWSGEGLIMLNGYVRLRLIMVDIFDILTLSDVDCIMNRMTTLHVLLRGVDIM